MSESEENKNQSLIVAARAAVNADDRYYDADGIPLTVNARGELVVMKELHALMVASDVTPVRRKGTSHHTELESFIAHVNRLKEERSTIWADVNRCLFTAIYNDDPAGADPSAAGWGDHQAQYLCPLAPEWKAWNEQQEEWMSQDAFAQWIDSRMEDLIESSDKPKPIELLEMSRNLQIFTTGTHTKKIDQTTGQYALVCKEEHTSESTKIPRVSTSRDFKKGSIGSSAPVG